jgi:arginase
MSGLAVIEAPSVLGLFPRGVENLPEALLDAGLLPRLGARHAGRVIPPPYDPIRDEATGLLNPVGLRDYSSQLADATGEVLVAGDVPVVLGGDCSIMLGILLALRRRGRYGLLFIDGHADFYQPDAEPNGEAASMDLALATGRGPDIVSNLEGRRPLVLDEDVVHFGRRDADEAAVAGSQRIEDTPIKMIDLDRVRSEGVERCAVDAIEHLGGRQLAGFWVHIDCDVIDDELMPAVDYRLPGGLTWAELEIVLTVAVDSGLAAGLDITIFNPTLDPDRTIARQLVDTLARGLIGRHRA